MRKPKKDNIKKLFNHEKNTVNSDTPCIGKKIFNFIELIALLITISGVGIIGIIKPLENYIEPLRLYNSEQKLQSIRIGCSEEYVKSILGIPQREIKESYKTQDGKSVKFDRLDYFNNDYIFTAFISESGVTVGYGLICRNKNFTPRLPYSNSYPIMTKSLYVNQSDECGNTEFIKYFINSRNDCGPFVMHFQSYGQVTNHLITGYGVSLLGYIGKSQDNKVVDYIEHLIDLNKKKGNEEGDIFLNEGFISSDDIHQNAEIINKYRKEITPNAIFVLKDDWEEMDGGSNEVQKGSNIMTNSEVFICDYFDTEFLLNGVTYNIMCDNIDYGIMGNDK